MGCNLLWFSTISGAIALSCGGLEGSARGGDSNNVGGANSLGGKSSTVAMLDVGGITAVGTMVGSGGAPSAGGVAATGGTDVSVGAVSAGGTLSATSGGSFATGTSSVLTGGTSAIASATGGSANGGSGGYNPAGPCPANAANSPCSGASLYCINEISQTCACAQGIWNCFGGDPLQTTESALTGAYHGQDNQACWTCAQEKCLNPQVASACEDVTTKSECLKLLTCELDSGCALTAEGIKSCYCGTTTPDGDCINVGAQNGVCLTEVTSGISYTTPAVILTHYTDSIFATGIANGLMQCLVDNACMSCFRSHDQNHCPVANAFQVTPTEANVGDTLTLTGQGTDIDQGPNPIVYFWTTLATGIGLISDTLSANTQYTCLAAGSDKITFSITDSDTLCTWGKSQTIHCY